jgi:16S rRNA (cytosine967-C5)-methyltransferase
LENQLLAVRALVLIEARGLPIPEAVERVCGDRPREVRRSVQAFVYETIKHRNLLDELIRAGSEAEPERIRSPYVKQILRVGTLEMKLWGNPAPAVTDCMVRLAKRLAGERAGSFVNAVLRGVERVSVEEVLEDRPWTERLALRYGHPEWFVLYALDLFHGDRERVERLLRANNRVPPQYLRINRLRLDPLTGEEVLRREYGIVVEPTFLEEVKVLRRGRGYGSRAWREGLFDVQDLASACASAALSPEPGEVVLDVCAAPGSKTTHLAEQMRDEGTIVSVDVSERGLEVLRRRCRRLGITCVETLCRDARGLSMDDLPEVPDRILVDPPCSTTGVWNRNPDSRWKPKPLERFARREWSILESALRIAEEHGCTLVYSTCSVSWEENEAIVKRALEEYDVRLVDADVPGSPGLREFRGERFPGHDKVRRYWPFRHDTAGFFVAKLRGG